MQKFKLFATGLLLMLIVLWLVSLFLPSAVTVSQTLLIDASDSAIAAQVENLPNWANWNPAYEGKTITTHTRMSGDTTYGWITDSSGRNLQVVLTRPASNVIEVDFPGSNGPKGSYQFVLIPKDHGQTQLTWNINTELGWYPWRKIVGIFLDKMTSPIYERAIHYLKMAAEPRAS
ncbi:MAG: SRPBCC family protein [Bacteroidota bacterium]|nr:SRPBCC family protein [Bacteroidota bacterium]